MLRFSVGLLALLAFGMARAEDGWGFQDKVFKDPDGKEAKWVLFIPKAAAKPEPGKKFPLIVFLHGSGETGTDGKVQSKVGLGPAVEKQKDTFPAYVIFPQSQKRSWSARRPDADRALAILDQFIKENPVDADRVYLTGLSMGGFGTFSLAAAEPKRWAAIVPICGGGAEADAEKYKHIPCWVFHGDQDKAVKVEFSRKLVAALKKAGAEPKYSEYPGVDHNSWDKAYATPELYTWLFAQSRKAN